MSEGPEVHRISGILNEEFAGSRIVSIESRLKKARTWLEEHPGALDGCAVENIRAAGKNIIWRLGGGYFFQIHLLMFGKIRTYSLRHHVEWERTTRAVIRSTRRQAVLENVQVFNIGQGDPFEEIESLREIGPDICAVPFDYTLFRSRLLDRSRSGEEIATVLLDQRVAAGLGNYLKSDILFECRINPWTKIGELTPEQLECLEQTIPDVGQRALRNRGQTVTDDYLKNIQFGEGEPPRGRWKDRHWVFRHTNRPCKVCGSPIRQRRQGPGSGRITFFCPVCQNVAA
jgi:DNA-formamidopyrimidine glycosylase